MMQGMGASPQNVGQGLNAIGQSIAGALIMRRAREEEATRQAATNKYFADAMSQLFGTGGATPAQAPGAAPSAAAGAPLSLTGPGQAAPGAAPGAPAQVAAAGGAGFSTGAGGGPGGVPADPAQRRAMAMAILSNPAMMADPRGEMLATMLMQPMQQRERKEGEMIVVEEIDPLTGAVREVSRASRWDPNSGTNVTVTTGAESPSWGEPPKDHIWALDSEGNVMLQPQTTPDGGTVYVPLAIPIAGGPAAREVAETEAAAVEREAQQQRAAGTVMNAIGRVRDMAANQDLFLPTTGLGGAILSAVPGTPAADMEAMLQTIRANIGFDRLQAMREASPTGGALGQVSEGERRALESTMGNLEQSQTQEQFLENLDLIEQQYLDIIHGPGNRPEAQAGAEDAATDVVEGADPRIATMSMDELMVFAQDPSQLSTPDLRAAEARFEALRSGM